MRIKTVRIKNFRTLYDVEINFHDITTFIGPNGSGKSTVLYALDWFFNGSKDGDLTEEDATYGHTDEPIEVAVTFNQLTDSDKQALGKYSSANADEFTAWKTRKDGKESLSANSKGNPLFNNIKNASSVKLKREEYTKIQEEYPGLALPKASTGAQINEAISAWEQSHSDQLEDIPEEVSTSFNGFNSNAAMKDIFNFTLVKADYRASEESEDSRASILGSIIERVVDRNAANEKIRELYSSIEEQKNQIYSESYSEQLIDLSSRMNSIIDSYSTGRVVTIVPKSQEIKPPKTSFSILAQEGEDKTEIMKQGHGFQRMLLISALQLLAETSGSGDSNGTLCLAIEEPELYQHPIQARTFAHVLKILGEDKNNSIQIIYDTHSPYFLESQHFDRIYRFVRHHGEETEVKLHSASKEYIEETLQNSGYPNATTRIGKMITHDLSSALFSNVVILVEGNTDAGFLEEIANRYFTSGESLSSLTSWKYGIDICNGNGKENLIPLQIILQAFGIPTLMMFDNDNNKALKHKTIIRETSDKRENAKKVNKKILRYLNTEEDNIEWPNGLYCDNTVFFVENTLEPFLEERYNGWDEAYSRAITETGNTSKKQEQNYRLAANYLNIADCPSEIIAFLSKAMELAKNAI